MNDRLELIIENETEIEIDTKILTAIRDVCLCCLDKESFFEKYKTAEISLTFVTNDEIKELNREYRNKDSVTDVLSFPQYEKDFYGTQPCSLLGDIVISIEKAVSQAEEYGHSLTRELCFVAVHSVLHLLGYDHITAEDETLMNGKQENILDLCGIRRGI